MSKVSNFYLSVVIKLLILIVLAKGIGVVLWWYLPDSGVSKKESFNFNPPYHRILFLNMLSYKTKEARKPEVIQKNSVGITSMILKGLYGNAKKGFIIVALKATPQKTSIVSIGERYAGYRLRSILKNGALFEKGGKSFVLKIALEKSAKRGHSSILKVRHRRAEVAEDTHSVSRRDIHYYEKNPNKIWRDISIMERKEGDKINGFRVTKIRRGSVMDKLGLRRGDIIMKANNRDLDSYKAAFDLYKKINTIKTLQLVVLRGNEEKELVYEIH